VAGFCEYGNETLGSIKSGECIDQVRNKQLVSGSDTSVGYVNGKDVGCYMQSDDEWYN
jgi:hypothetical protein